MKTKKWILDEIEIINRILNQPDLTLRTKHFQQGYLLALKTIVEEK